MTDLVQSANDWFENKYVKGFIEGDPDFLNNYADTVLFVVGDSAHSLNTKEFGAAIEETYVNGWMAAGLTDIAMVESTVSVIGVQTVCIDARWKLLDDQGKSVASCGKPGWNYIMIYTGSSWKVLAEIESSAMD